MEDAVSFLRVQATIRGTEGMDVLAIQGEAGATIKRTGLVGISTCSGHWRENWNSRG